MDYDIAKLSPSMSQERLMNSHGAAMIKLAKKTMEQKSDMLGELMDSASVSVASSSEQATIDIKL